MNNVWKLALTGIGGIVLGYAISSKKAVAATPLCPPCPPVRMPTDYGTFDPTHTVYLDNIGRVWVKDSGSTDTFLSYNTNYAKGFSDGIGGPFSGDYNSFAQRMDAVPSRSKIIGT